jgi:hypothetical protein
MAGDMESLSANRRKAEAPPIPTLRGAVVMVDLVTSATPAVASAFFSILPP